MKRNLQNRRKINKFSSTMSIRYWALVLLALLGNSGVAQATALQLVFTPSSKTVNVGDNFVIDFAITGLDSGVQSDIISAFDVFVSFDPTLLNFTGISFGNQLGAGSDQDSGYLLYPSGVSTVAEFYQVSYLVADATLKGLQMDTSVTLGSLSFNARAAGTSALDFVATYYHLDFDMTYYQTVGGALDSTPPPVGPLATLLTVEAQSGSVTINSGQNTPVPEPATLLLLGVGLILASHRQSRYHPYTNDSNNNPEESLL